MPKKQGYPDGTKPPENPGTPNFLGGTTPESAAGLIGDLEAEGNQDGGQVAQAQQVDIPLSIAPHLQGVSPGDQTELHIVATVGNVGDDNVTLNISKAFEMKQGKEPGPSTPQVEDPSQITTQT